MKHKKFLMVLLLLPIVASGVFASEQWVGVSFSYDWSQRFVADQARTHSFGGEGTNYTFFGDGNMGMRLGFDFLIPFSGSKLVNGERKDVSMAEAPMLVALQFGPSYKYDVTDWFTVYGGLGINASYTSQGGEVANIATPEKPYYGRYLDWQFGVLADLGMRFGIGDTFGIRVGTTLGTNFLQYRSFTVYIPESESNTQTSVKRSGWTDGYVDFSVKPYIGVSASF